MIGLILLLLIQAKSPAFEGPLAIFEQANLRYLADRCSNDGRRSAEAACRDGATVCCLQAAEAWYRGVGECSNSDYSAGYRKSLELLEEGCAQGSSVACSLAATPGRWKIVPGLVPRRPDLASRAQSLSVQNCDGGNPGECVQAAAYADEEGRPGGAAFRTRAFSLWKSACDENRADDCFDLAYNLGLGYLTDDNPDRYFRKACDLGLGQACREVKPGPICIENVRILQRGCSLGSYGSCMDAAKILASPPRGCSRDPAAALVALDEACRLGVWEACHSAAAVYSRSKAASVRHHGAALRQLACDRGIGRELCGLPRSPCIEPVRLIHQALPAPRIVDPSQAEKWRKPVR